MLRAYAFAGVLTTFALAVGAGCTVEPSWEATEGHAADPGAPVAEVHERRSPLDAESHLAFRIDDDAGHEPHDHEHDAHGHEHGHSEHENGHGHGHGHHEHGHDHGDVEVIEHGPDADYSRYCVVSGEPLGEFGDPYVVEHEGRFLLTCCQGCSRDFAEEPEKYLNRLDGIFDDDHDHDGHGHDHDDDNDDNDHGHAH